MSKPVTVTLTAPQARILWRLIQEGRESVAPEWISELEAPSAREYTLMDRAIAKFRAACGDLIPEDEQEDGAE